MLSCFESELDRELGAQGFRGQWYLRCRQWYWLRRCDGSSWSYRPAGSSRSSRCCKAGDWLGLCSREHLLHLSWLIFRRRRSKGVLRLRLVVVVRSGLIRLDALNHIVHGVPAKASEVDQRSRC